MNNQNSISIDEAKFLKTSKKLLSSLNNESIETLKLSRVQEILAQSLGYRNLHDLKNVFSDIENSKEINPILKIDLLSKFKVEEITNIIINLMDQGEHDMWRSRAISLLSTVIKVLVYMKAGKEIIFNVSTINQYLILDNLINVYKTRRDFPNDIREDIYVYLQSLPGFREDAPKQTNTTLEQHGFLQMQFISALNKLKNIEKNDLIVASNSWFIVNQKQNSDLKKENINFSIIKKNIETTVELNPKLHDYEILAELEDSWISLPEYEEWIVSLHNKKKLKELRVSDMIIYMTNVMSPVKKEKMNLILKTILDNYSLVADISKKINDRLK